MQRPENRNVRIALIREPIATDLLLESVTVPDAGAVVLFLGTTRDQTRGRATESLDYEAYDEMALKQLERLAEDARGKWELSRVAIVHRLGHLVPTDASVAIAVSSPHRDAAFEAGRWLIDELKRVVPIWKRENWADGACEWAMPGINRPSEGG